MRRAGAGLLALLLAAAWAASASASPSGQVPLPPPPVASATQLAAARNHLWHGELAAAERAFLEILALRPGDVDAWIGLAQARRWSGRPLAALEPAARAVALAPARRDAREELAWAYADAGRPRRAESVLRAGGVEPSPDLARALERKTAPVLSLSGTAYDDSSGMKRLAPRLSLALSLPADVRLVLGGGATRVRDGGAPIDRGLAGGSLSVPWDRVSFSAAVAFQGAGGPLLDGQLSIAWQPLDALRLSLGARRRTFLEPPEPLAVDEEAFYAAGVGGAVDPWAMVPRRVDEGRFRLGASPWSGAYLYADAKAFRVSDGNSGYSVAAGAGVDLIALFAKGSPLGLTARWDTYTTGFARQLPLYYSPLSLVAQSPGAALALRLGAVLELTGEGGRTFAAGEPGGWYGGAGSRLRLGGFSLSLRAQARDDPWYRSRRAWLDLEIPF